MQRLQSLTTISSALPLTYASMVAQTRDGREGSRGGKRDSCVRGDLRALQTVCMMLVSRVAMGKTRMETRSLRLVRIYFELADGRSYLVATSAWPGAKGGALQFMAPYVASE